MRARAAVPCLLGAWLLLASATGMAGCAALMDAARQRLALLGIAFAVDRLDVSRLVFPSSVFGVADLGRYGVDVRVSIRAENSKPARAVFDGAAARLRVRKTGPSDPSVTGTLPAFTVEGNSKTTFDVVFPLRLDSPIFGREVWKDIVQGKDTPYQVDANLSLRFPEGMPAGVPAEVKTMPMKVVASKVNVRENSGPVVEGLLKAIALAF